MKPGPRVGEILKIVYELQMDGRITNLDEAVAALRNTTDLIRFALRQGLINTC